MNPPGIVKIHIMRSTEAELRQADILFDFDVCGWPRKLNNLTRCKMPIVSVIAFYVHQLREITDSKRELEQPACGSRYACHLLP